MNSLLAGFTHLRTTVPGIGLLLIAAGHYYQTGTFNIDDLIAIVGAFGLTQAKDAAK